MMEEEMEFELTASVSAPSGTQRGNFNVGVSFNARVIGFSKEDVSIGSTGGNGTIGVDFEILGVGANYNLDFNLPEEKQGSFLITISGALFVPDEQPPPDPETGEDIVIYYPIESSISFVYYDDITSVIADFEDPVYEDNGDILVSIEFRESILYFSKTDFKVESVDGDNIFDFEYFLIGGQEDYALVIVPKPDRIGVLSVDITEHVWKSTDVIRENVDIFAKLVPFNSRKPYVVDYEYPSGRVLRAGTWDVFMELDVPAIGVGVDKFTYTGVNPSTPTLYLGNSLDIKPIIPPPPIDRNNPPACVGEWTSDSTGNSVKPAKYLLLRFNVPAGAGGEFSLDLIPGSIRGAI